MAVAHPRAELSLWPLFEPANDLSAEFVSGHSRGVHAMTNLLEQAINERRRRRRQAHSVRARHSGR